MKKIASGYRLIFGYLGLFIAIVGGITLLPLLTIPFLESLNSSLGFRDAHWWPAFVIPGVAAMIIGLFLFFFLLSGRKRARLGKHQDSLLLVLIWMSAILISSVPFILRNYNFYTGEYDRQFTFISALFETASGYCSIGLTVFKGMPESGVISVPTLEPTWDGYYIYAMYRSVLLFFGGVGLVLVVTSAISDRYGLNLYNAEGHNDKLMPNLASSAKLILGIYLIYIVLGTIAYVLAGCSFFDGINHSISALSTGGFTTHAESIAYYEIHKGEMVGGFWGCKPLAIEIISMVLMILGMTNIITHYLLFRRKFVKAINDSEMKIFGILVLIFVPLLLISMISKMGDGVTFGKALRYSLFYCITCLSTTGFSNTTEAFTGLTYFGSTAVYIMIIMMFIGGGVGSTSGAVKQQRVYLSFWGLYWSIRRRFAAHQLKLPRQFKRHGETVIVKDEDIHEANSMLIIYLLILLIGSLLLCLIMKWQPHESLFEFMSALSSTGLSLFDFPCVSQTVSEAWMMIILVLSMFLGRLEILPVIFSFICVGNDISKIGKNKKVQLSQ